MIRAAILVSLLACFVSGCAVLPGKRRWQKTERMQQAAGTHRPMRLDYLLHIPRGKAPTDGWPLVLFLHGAGERGSDVWQVATHGPPALLAKDPGLRECVVVSPQCPSEWWWDSVTLKQLLDEVIAAQKIDRSRLYITGLSMGGYGTWHMLTAYPGLFAAAAPICGGGDPNRYKTRGARGWIPVTFNEALLTRIRSLPIWVFHGARDTAVPIAESQRLVKKLRALGSPVRYTVYPDAGHDSWTATYANPAVWEWLLSQRRR